MMPSLSLLALVLGATPTPASAMASPRPAVLRVASGQIQDDVAPLDALEQARILANDNPAKFAEQLAEAIAAMEADPSLVDDAEAQSQRQRALLTLARAYLKAGREDAAAAVMDRAIRTSLGQAVPAANFGPTLEALYVARRDALGEASTLELTCPSACVFVVAGRTVEAGELDVAPGEYAVQAGPDLAAALDAELRTISVGPGERETVAWRPPPPPAPAIDTDALDGEGPVDEPDRDHDRDRMLPRWAEITGLVVGLGAVGAGVALLAIDGGCPGGEDPTDPDACPDVYETTGAGAAALAVGGALAITSGVLLGIDEVRTRDGQRQARLFVGYTGRF